MSGVQASASSSKAYGLQLPVRMSTKSSQPTVLRASAFVDADDDDDDEDSHAALAREQAAASARAAAATSAMTSKDAALLDYDGWKDGDEVARAEAAAAMRSAPAARASRYIGALLAKAEERSALRDVAFERRLAREREAEDGEHAGKEAFVTGAYAAKLAERRALIEAQAAADTREATARLDQGLGSFYGNLAHNVALGGSAPAHAGEPVRLVGTTRAPSSTLSESARASVSNATTSDRVDSVLRSDEHIAAEAARVPISRHDGGGGGNSSGPAGHERSVDAEISSSHRRAPLTQPQPHPFVTQVAAPPEHRVNDGGAGIALSASVAHESRNESESAAAPRAVDPWVRRTSDEAIAAARLAAEERYRVRIRARTVGAVHM